MHNLRFGGSLIHHTTGGTGSERGTAVLGTFTFLTTTTRPFTDLTLAGVQQYTQRVSYGISSHKLKEWMSVAFVQDAIRVGDDITVDAGVRYDRQTLTDATANFGPRLGFGWHPHPVAAGGLQRLQPRQHPRPCADHLRRHGSHQSHARSSPSGRPPTRSLPGEHRSAADVPASGALHVLTLLASGFRFAASGASEASGPGRDRVTFDSTPSRTGVITPSCRARMTASQSGSNFFHPAA